MKNSEHGSPVLILMRHATRDPLGRDGLSPEGREIAMKLAKAVQEKRIPRPHRLVATPRNRSQETLKPLSENLLLDIEIEEACNERSNNESEADFSHRVRNFVQSANLCVSPQREPQTWIVVSHLDWLEAAVLFLESDETELEQSEPWSPGSKRIYYRTESLWRRRRL